ncbi:MAG: hypothetical protein GC179_10705 [Anaerolineaceae bacterium]|nr:hypothetical protein [Anaerolineaceae bacterium]
MTRLWRAVFFVLLMVNSVGIALVLTLGRILPASPEISFQFGQGTTRSLFLLDIDHHLSFQLARGANPYPSMSWSPDGKQLAYVATVNGHSDVFRLDVECTSLFSVCGKSVNLTQNSASDGEPVWSPDGRSIVFVSERNGAPELYWMPTTGGAAYNLTHDSASDSFPVWSPDGRMLAFYSDRSGFLEVYVMNMDCLRQIATCPSAIHRLGGGFNSLPAWSPDSKQLAYFANGDLLLVPSECLARSDTCADSAYNLTRSPFTDWYPVWSPDNQRLLFQSNRSSQPQIYTADVQCESALKDCAKPLKNALSYSLYPSFSPDGHQIMLLSNDSNSQELFLLSVTEGTVRQITHMGGQISSARWRPTAP